MLKILISLVAAIYLTGCGNHISTNNTENNNLTTAGIIGGVQAERNDLITKSTVAFLHKPIINGLYEVNCSGTLISKDLILTAAHCLHSAKDLKTSAIYFGVVLPYTKMEHTRQLDSWIEYPNIQPVYDEKGLLISQLHDIAIIKIKGEAPEGFHPVKIAANSEIFKAGDQITVAGFGLKNDAFQMRTDALRLAVINIDQIWNTHIITNQTNEKGICLGDSGGPAYIEKNGELLLIGATRGAHKAAKNCRAFAEITSIPENLEFIMSASKSLSDSLPETQD